jgi:hypothetical protein
MINLTDVGELMNYQQLQESLITQQQEKAFSEYEGEPDNFWQWYRSWCYENSYFYDA